MGFSGKNRNFYWFDIYGPGIGIYQFCQGDDKIEPSNHSYSFYILDFTTSQSEDTRRAAEKIPLSIMAASVSASNDIEVSITDDGECKYIENLRPVNIENGHRSRAINIFYPGISPLRGDFMPELNVHGSKNYGFYIGVMYQYDINGLLVSHETHGKTEKNLMYDGINKHDNCDYVKSYTNKYGVKITIYFYNKHNYVMRHIEKYVNGKYVDSWKQIDVEVLNVLDEDWEYELEENEDD